MKKVTKKLKSNLGLLALTVVVVTSGLTTVLATNAKIDSNTANVESTSAVVSENVVKDVIKEFIEPSYNKTYAAKVSEFLVVGEDLETGLYKLDSKNNLGLLNIYDTNNKVVKVLQISEINGKFIELLEGDQLLIEVKDKEQELVDLTFSLYKAEEVNEGSDFYVNIDVERKEAIDKYVAQGSPETSKYVEFGVAEGEGVAERNKEYDIDVEEEIRLMEEYLKRVENE